MQANQSPVIWTVIICTVVLLIAGFLMANSAKNAVGDVTVPTASEIASLISVPAAGEIPTAEEIAAAMPEADTSRLCKLTAGCEYWEPTDCGITDYHVLDALTDDSEATEDFVDAFSDLIELDDDEYRFVLSGDNELAEDVSWSELGQFYKDYQIRIEAIECPEDHEDANWEVKVFMRVKYFDIDEGLGDRETIYLLVTSTLDESEYEDLTIEEVTRNFEFE